MPLVQSVSRAFLGAVLAIVVSVATQSSVAQAFQDQYEGTLGKSRVGLTIISEANKIEGGHYFYQRFLKDIPIVGTVQGSDVTLTEPGGGTFHLHFVGNGSEGTEPLNFENSIGLDGYWSTAEGDRRYAVSLRGTSGGYWESGHRYVDITGETDAAFETRVQSLLRAVLSGDKAEAIRLISFPLKVNLSDRRSKRYAKPTEVLAHWDEIFTPAMVASLDLDLPHDMFVHNGMAMLGNGEAWFDAKGLAVVNLPEPSKKAGLKP